MALDPSVDELTPRRPMLVVRNADRSGPTATLSYTFEIATDGDFTSVTTRGSVAEGVGQTTFTPSDALASGTTYFWRASASAIDLGVTGAHSSTGRFTTAFFDNGWYRHRMVVRSPAWCTSHYTVPTGHALNDRALPGWVLPDFSFDGMLEVEGDRLSYVAGLAWDDRPIRLLDLRWTAGRYTGQAGGAVRPESGAGLRQYPGWWIDVVSLSGGAEGGSVVAGRFDGTFAGTVTLAKIGFPSEWRATCEARDFAWTLIPR